MVGIASGGEPLEISLGRLRAARNERYKPFQMAMAKLKLQM